MAQKLAKIYIDNKIDLPPDIDEIVNPKDIDRKVYNLLQHAFWRENSVPVYDNDPHWHHISLNPDEPESFVNYFWQDEDLLKIVRETNKYIDKKNQLKKKATNVKNIPHTTLKELKRFIGVVMYMATFGLAKARNYWREQHETVTQHFTIHRFEQLCSSIHFNCTNSTGKSHDKSGEKVQPLIDFLNDRLSTLQVSKQLCIDEMMISSKSKFGPRVY